VGGAREPRSPEGSNDWLIYAASRAGIATDELIPKHGVGPRGGIGAVRGTLMSSSTVCASVQNGLPAPPFRTWLSISNRRFG
jgi:hypothetical protein